jgi:hypothetical protein
MLKTSSSCGFFIVDGLSKLVYLMTLFQLRIYVASNDGRTRFLCMLLTFSQRGKPAGKQKIQTEYIF